MKKYVTNMFAENTNRDEQNSWEFHPVDSSFNDRLLYPKYIQYGLSIAPMKKYILRPEALLTNIIIFVCPVFLIYITINKILDDASALEDVAFLAFIAVVIIVSFIYFGISLSFMREDIGKSIVVDSDEKTLLISKDGSEKQIKVKDIIKCYYVKSSESVFSRTIFSYHMYLVFILKDFSRVYITNLIVNPEVLISELGLKADKIETYLPYVDKNIGSALYNKENYDLKVNEFYLAFASKSIDELQLICKRSSLYSPYAVIAAKKRLNEKLELNKKRT